MNTTTPSVFAGALLAGALLLTGCSPQRTITTNASGVRIDQDVLDGLRTDMTTEDWLVLHYGEPTGREATTTGTILTWTYTRHTHEHRPDPHDELYTRHSHVALDANGRFVRAWSDETDERLD